MEVLKKLEGAYAVLVKSTHYPGELVACKRGSPMILGIRDPTGQRRASFNRLKDADDKKWRQEAIECWVASDASAVVEHTKRCGGTGGCSGFTQCDISSALLVRTRGSGPPG